MKPLQRLAPDWQLLSRLLDEALALPAQERQAWLAALAPEAEHLRPQLRDLLEVQEAVETGTFLEALPVLPGLRPAAGGVQPGDTVGPYRIVGELGRGGMGTVWLAERADGQLKRRCALKLPAFAWSDALRERMAQERDILASLDHPHIARLLDAGADEQGRPFLALEHVQGEAIDRWADRKLLPVRARVELFVQVVDAIRYAHANLVIHRDLKPSNILVTEAGQCKLLDFGIAKLMSDAQAAEQAAAPPDLTLTGQRLLTPRYASPEQVLGQRLTAASDVYSLGVVLYELLCGSTPYEAGDRARPLLEQAILDGHVRASSRQPEDGEAARLRGTTPQRLARQLHGELDAILLRALGRQPQDRYPSAEALQADLLAWLENRPIQARKPGVLATAWKFVRRHRWPVAIGTAGVVATVAMALVAAGMAWRSEREAQSAGAARDFLIDLLKGATPVRKQGREPTIRELLEDAEGAAGNRFAGQPALEAAAQKELAQLWAGFGAHEKRAAALERRSVALESMGNHAVLAQNVLVQAKVALEMLRDIDQARRHLDRFLAIAELHSVSASSRFEHDYWRGWLETRRGDFESSRLWFERARARARELGTPYSLSLALRALSLAEYRLGRWNESNASFQEVRQLVRTPSPNWDEAERRDVRWELASDYLTRGDFSTGWDEVQALMKSDEATRGRFAVIGISEQREWLRWSIAMRRESQALEWLNERERFLVNSNPPAPDPDWLMLEAHILGLTGNVTKARATFDRAAERAQSVFTGQARSAFMVRLESSRARMGLQLGDTRLTVEAAARLASIQDLDRGSRTDRLRVAMHDYLAGVAARTDGRLAEATALLKQAIPSLEALMGPQHPDVLIARLNHSLSIWESTLDPSWARKANEDYELLRAILPPEHSAARIAESELRGTNSAIQGSSSSSAFGQPLMRRPRQALML